MKYIQKHWIGLFGIMGMVLLLLDPKTALTGAREGIDLCISSVIPSLFPFFIFSGIITSRLCGRPVNFLRPVGKFCRIPEGTESLLLLGFLGGYPIGAHNINNTYKHGKISKQDTHRLLGFCNNPGPSFIFGILGGLFQSPAIPWLIWGVIILSALLTGSILPGKSTQKAALTDSVTVSFTEAMNSAIRAIASVCGWVVFFRVLNMYLDKLLLAALPATTGAFLTGILELTNGCHALYALPSQGCRFVLSVTMLSFGGLCVLMQTSAATSFAGTGFYFPGKLLQTAIAFILAYTLQPIFFSGSDILTLPIFSIVTAILFIICVTFILHHKKM